MYIQSMGYEEEKRKDVLYGYPNTIISYAIPSPRIFNYTSFNKIKKSHILDGL